MLNKENLGNTEKNNKEIDKVINDPTIRRESLLVFGVGPSNTFSLSFVHRLITTEIVFYVFEKPYILLYCTLSSPSNTQCKYTQSKYILFQDNCFPIWKKSH